MTDDEYRKILADILQTRHAELAALAKIKNVTVNVVTTLIAESFSRSLSLIRAAIQVLSPEEDSTIELCNDYVSGYLYGASKTDLV